MVFIEEYIEMMFVYLLGGGSGGRLFGYRYSVFVFIYFYFEEGLEMYFLERGGGYYRLDILIFYIDDGYMFMFLGVVLVFGSRKGSGDYMFMSFKSVFVS